jgi:serine/threonine-protein kinase
VETGHLVYAAAGTLRAVRFDLARLEVLSDPVLVVERVLTKPLTNVADFSVSRHGTLVYVSGGTSATTMLSTLVWVDRKGHEDPIAAPPRGYVYPRLSPDGKRIALDIRDQQNDIWIWDFGRQNLYRLTTDPGINRMPAWTRDSKRVAFTAERDGVESIHWQAFDGSGTMERLSIGTQYQAPQAFSPDSTRLIFVAFAAPFDLGVIDLGANHNATMFLHTAANETNAEISPDGRWLAYQSDESGREEVYVRPFPKVDTALHLVSSGGGTRPLWSRDGRELFYLMLPGTIMAVPVSTAADIAFGKPEPVVKGTFSVPQLGRTYDVSADGQRFLLLKDAPTPDGRKPAAPELHVVLNWHEELKRLVPVK